MQKILILFLFIISSLEICSQSNELLDSFFEQEYGDVATSLLFIGQAAGLLSSETTPSEAYTWGVEQNFGKRISRFKSDDPITLGVFYLAMFESFGVKGGIWYTIFKSPRQAALEAGYKGYIDSSTLYYNRKMSPYEILTSLTVIQEGGEW